MIKKTDKNIKHKRDFFFNLEVDINGNLESDNEDLQQAEMFKPTYRVSHSEMSDSRRIDNFLEVW